MQLQYRLILILLGALLMGTSATAQADVTYFQQGNEAAVVALLKPHTDEDLAIGPWTLATLEVGPTCELRFGFAKGAGAAEVTATLTPAAGGAGSFAYAWAPSRPEDLGDPFEALINGNDPGEFFVERCLAPEDPVKGDVEDPTVEEQVAAWVPTPASALWIAALVLGLLGLAVLGWKSKKKGKKGAAPPAATPEPIPEAAPEATPEEAPPEAPAETPDETPDDKTPPVAPGD